MQYEFFDRFNLIVTQFTISNTLHIMRINRKNFRRIIAERSQFYRDAYYLIINIFIYDQLVYLNENVINEYIM